MSSRKQTDIATLLACGVLVYVGGVLVYNEYSKRNTNSGIHRKVDNDSSPPPTVRTPMGDGMMCKDILGIGFMVVEPQIIMH